jgi:hypothetical protein
MRYVIRRARASNPATPRRPYCLCVLVPIPFLES